MSCRRHVEGDQRAEDGVGGCELPEHLPGGGCEPVGCAPPCRLGDPFDHLESAVVEQVGQGRAAVGGASQGGRPLQAAVGVEGLDGVRVGGPGKVRAGTDDDPGGAAGQEAADGGGGVDGLRGVVVADEAALAVQDPEVAALGVGPAAPVAGGLGPTLDDVGLAGAVEVGQGGGGEHAVRREEGPSLQRGAASGVQCVLFLAQRPGDHSGGALQRTHRQGGLDTLGGAGVGRRLDHVGVPEPVAAGPVGEVAAGCRVCGIAGADEHGVEAAPTEGGHRRRGVDRGAAILGGPASDRRPTCQVVRVHLPRPVTDDHGRAAGQVGHVGGRLGYRVAAVGQCGLPLEGDKGCDRTGAAVADGAEAGQGQWGDDEEQRGGADGATPPVRGTSGLQVTKGTSGCRPVCGTR